MPAADGKKNPEGMYMKKVVAMNPSPVLAPGLIAGCGQKDPGKASGGPKTNEGPKNAVPPPAPLHHLPLRTADQGKFPGAPDP